MFKFARRHVVAVSVSILALGIFVSGTAFAASMVRTADAKTKTVSFIGTPATGQQTLFSMDGLIVKAGCDATTGNPTIKATTTTNRADIAGSVAQMGGPSATYGDDAFNSASKPVDLTGGLPGPDFDASGHMVFERINGAVVTLTYGFDNAVTLNGPPGDNHCTVFGSVTATADN